MENDDEKKENPLSRFCRTAMEMKMKIAEAKLMNAETERFIAEEERFIALSELKAAEIELEAERMEREAEQAENETMKAKLTRAKNREERVKKNHADIIEALKKTGQPAAYTHTRYVFEHLNAGVHPISKLDFAVCYGLAFGLETYVTAPDNHKLTPRDPKASGDTAFSDKDKEGSAYEDSKDYERLFKRRNPHLLKKK